MRRYEDDWCVRCDRSVFNCICQKIPGWPAWPPAAEISKRLKDALPLPQKKNFMKPIINALLWLIAIAATLHVIWVIGCLYATLRSAEAAQPAIVKVIGTPSAWRTKDDIYMRWHRCLWCD